MPDQVDRFRGCLLGLAVGDAVGTALEFTTRGSFEPITDMVGGGPFRLEPGQWTDDTSMALCLATSLVRQGGFDARDQMQRYCDWVENGTWSSTGRCFDLGNTVAMSLEEFWTSGNPFAGPTGERTAGNGSLMRLAPVVMFFYPDREEAIRFAAESSRTTHGAPECLDGCRIMSEILLRALGGASRQEILTTVEGKFCSPALQSIAELEFQGKPRTQIRGRVTSCSVWRRQCGASTRPRASAKRYCWRRISARMLTRPRPSAARWPVRTMAPGQSLTPGCRD